MYVCSCGYVQGCYKVVNNSYMTFIGVHEMHGRMHPNKCHITILLAHDPLSSSAYLVITYTPPVAVARQLPANSIKFQ